MHKYFKTGVLNVSIDNETVTSEKQHEKFPFMVHMDINVNPWIRFYGLSLNHLTLVSERTWKTVWSEQKMEASKEKRIVSYETPN